MADDKEFDDIEWGFFSPGTLCPHIWEGGIYSRDVQSDELVLVGETYPGAVEEMRKLREETGMTAAERAAAEREAYRAARRDLTDDERAAGWLPFTEDVEIERGMWLRVREDATGEEADKTLLVGDVNELLGLCDDCSINKDDLLAYRYGLDHAELRRLGLA